MNSLFIENCSLQDSLRKRHVLLLNEVGLLNARIHIRALLCNIA